MEIKYVPIEKIRPYENNAKKHKIAWIEKSIETFSFDQPIVVDGEGVIIKGHGRYEAAKKLGFDKVPVIIRDDLNKEQAAMSRLADNRTQQGGGFDFSKLGNELDFLKNKFDLKFLDSVGFSPAFLKKGAKEDLGINLSDDGDEDNEAEYKPPPIVQKRILSIVLDADAYQSWVNYKEKCKKKTDTMAFLHLLDGLNDD